jgi:hypothetical protein
MPEKSDLNKIKESSSKIAFCPYCGEAGENAGVCDNGKCARCRKDFCYLCSAKRNPILAHCNSYHRKHCIYYSPNDNNKYEV